MSMSEIKFDPIVTRYHGFFSYPELYKLMREFLVVRHYEFQEKIYKDKPATHFGNEIELTWLAERKETEFIKYKYEFSILVTDNQEVDVVKDGIKNKLNKARLKLRIIPSIEYDWQGKYKTNAEKIFLGFLWGTVLKWDYKIKHATRISNEAHFLNEKIKSFLNMQV
jgi:hypothetical protein